jgi:hypothetical protein
MSGTPHPLTQHQTPRRLAWSATPCENLKSCKLPTVLTTASLHNHPPKAHMSSATNQLHRSVPGMAMTQQVMVLLIIFNPGLTLATRSQVHTVALVKIQGFCNVMPWH